MGSPHKKRCRGPIRHVKNTLIESPEGSRTAPRGRIGRRDSFGNAQILAAVLGAIQGGIGAVEG